MCLRVSYKKKYEIFFCINEVGSASVLSGTRTKMSGIPNTGGKSGVDGPWYRGVAHRYHLAGQEERLPRHQWRTACTRLLLWHIPGIPHTIHPIH